MYVKELREILSTMPDDAYVRYVWDGEPRSSVRCVWLARNGAVILADRLERVYSEAARPPEAEVGRYSWNTPDVEDDEEWFPDEH